MAILTELDRAVIAKYPLGDDLRRVQSPFRQIEQSHQPPIHDDAIHDVGLAPSRAILSLLYTLCVQEAAVQLHSKLSTGYLVSDIEHILGRVRDADFEYDHYRALSQLVVEKAPDLEIWTAVFQLVRTISPATPPRSAPLPQNTPIKRSSASQTGTEQTRRLLEDTIFEEIKHCTHLKVRGFDSKYFTGKAWTEDAREIYRVLKHRHSDGKWTAFPDPPVEDAVIQWWFEIQKHFPSHARGVYCTSKSPKDLLGGQSSRQLDIFLKRKEKENPGMTHRWADVQVIGEFKQSKDDLKANLLQRSVHVRDIFTAQPTRRYVHSFVMCGSKLDLWVFDRAGPYSSGAFDIHDEPERFIRVMAGYAMMSDEELGLDTQVEREGEKLFAAITDDATKARIRLQIEPTPIATQLAIVCRGTTCFVSTDRKRVVKFSWTTAARSHEATLLELARKNGSEGTAELHASCEMISIRQLREGLVFTQPHHFRGAPLAVPSFPAPPLPLPFNRLRNFRSGGAGPNPDEAGKRPPKRSVGASKGTGVPPGSRATHAAEKTPTASAKTASGEPFEDRVLCCLVISPAGRPLREYRSIRELLEALRDAVKAHQSLHAAGILHRDISTNNIIITNPREAHGFTGMLIDLDHAKEMGQPLSGAQHRTGTMQFMTIGVLYGDLHTYRHDLESFFYVFLWACIRYGVKASQGQEMRMPEVLKQWCTGTDTQIRIAKRGAMDSGGFKDILDAFDPSFDSVKDTAKTIRAILFPVREGGLYIDTPTNPDLLYGRMIEAFENAASQERRP
ncbi:MAG: hypothetical protein M1826_000031 [Phylliscum demangeonii]|nr:MAG: hypothetical protein M1826_000031 [Phylliscum demangeonii]